MTSDLDRALEAYTQASKDYRNAEHGMRRKARQRFEKAANDLLKADVEKMKQERAERLQARYESTRQH